jgi:outer membrane lipoprotein-sorting protein
MKVRSALVLTTLVALFSSPVRAQTAAQWIAKARAYQGSDSALNAITSIHFTGTLEAMAKVPLPDDKTRQIDQLVRLPVDIVFQKPYQQRMTVTKPGTVETTALDGYDGWERSINTQNPKQWRFSLLDGQRIKRLRANTWENLNYYTGLEKKGGSVRLSGDATVDGVACVKISFIHADNIVFQRYFEKATGRLVKTETENGGELREEGEMTVNGVRFPRKVINKDVNGLVQTLAIDKVVLNERIPASEFTVPALPAN